jgi:hypothetical protein
MHDWTVEINPVISKSFVFNICIDIDVSKYILLADTFVLVKI